MKKFRMHFQLNNIQLPFLQKSDSDIWNKTLVLGEENTLIKAPSGTGKTSLFNVLSGNFSDFIGTLLVNEKDFKGFSDAEKSVYRQKSISTVYQNLRLLDELTAFENVILKNELTNQKSESEMKALFEKLGIADQMNQTVGTLSQGQKQRVAIIRALCQPFQILLLDEPFSHLDSDNTKAAVTLIKTELEANNAKLILLSLEETYGFSFTKTLQL